MSIEHWASERQDSGLRTGYQKNKIRFQLSPKSAMRKGSCMEGM
jgi:hypothetical protein